MSVDAANALIHWYDANARILPWRARPGETPDPYRVWLSESMLQPIGVAPPVGAGGLWCLDRIKLRRTLAAGVARR